MRGYLQRQIADGDAHAVETLLEGSQGSRLPASARLEIASIGQRTDRMAQIVESAIASLPIAEVVRRIPRHDDDDELRLQLEEWSNRIETQADYNALVDWLSFALHGRERLPDTLTEATLALALRRRDFPRVGTESWDWGRIANAVLPGNEQAMASLVLDLLEHHDLITIGGEGEAQILRSALERRTPAVWQRISDRLEAGSWRISMSVRPWLLAGIDPGPIEDWIGDNVERARIVAQIAPVGDDEPTPIARHLLENFGDDEEVGSSLYGALVSGSWVGNESDRIELQIDQLNAWRENAQELPGVRMWAGEVVQSLTDSRQAALEREAERDF